MMTWPTAHTQVHIDLFSFKLNRFSSVSIQRPDIESSSTERNSSCSRGSTVSTLQLHTPGFGVQSHHQIVLPKPEPHIEFPAPPPPPLPHHSSAYEYYTNVSAPSSSSQYDSRCYECVDDPHMLYGTNPNTPKVQRRPQRRLRRSTSTSNLYEYFMDYEEPIYYERFGLSKKGLLQIDYSCNWNNLQRMITSKWTFDTYGRPLIITWTLLNVIAKECHQVQRFSGKCRAIGMSWTFVQQLYYVQAAAMCYGSTEQKGVVHVSPAGSINIIAIRNRAIFFYRIDIFNLSNNMNVV